jgi:hypothetical protein
VANALRQHFDHVAAQDTTYVFSSLLGGSADRAAASPSKALLLRRAPIADLQKVVAQGLLQYEREVKELNLELFPEALDNAVHMERVLSPSPAATCCSSAPRASAGARCCRSCATCTASSSSRRR